jgi:hypothetical protein
MIEVDGRGVLIQVRGVSEHGGDNDGRHGLT